MSELNPSRRDVLRISSASALGAGLLSAIVANAQEQAKPLAPPDKQPDDLKIPPPFGKTVNYAVVGLGHLALDEVIPAFHGCKRSRLVALVSGHPDKAKKVAATYGVDPKNTATTTLTRSKTILQLMWSTSFCPTTCMRRLRFGH